MPVATPQPRMPTWYSSRTYEVSRALTTDPRGLVPPLMGRSRGARRVHAGQESRSRWQIPLR